MARTPLLEQSELPDDYQYLLGEEAMGEINLLRAMANNPDVLGSYMRYGTTLWGDGGLDGAPEVLRNARSYADDPEIGYVRGDFGSLPFADDSISHVFSMKGELRNKNSRYSRATPPVIRVLNSR